MSHLPEEIPPEEKQNADILILGIGNLLMGDEGLGVHLIRELETEELPPGVALLDGGTAGFNLMSWLEDHRHVAVLGIAIGQRTKACSLTRGEHHRLHCISSKCSASIGMILSSCGWRARFLFSRRAVGGMNFL